MKKSCLTIFASTALAFVMGAPGAQAEIKLGAVLSVTGPAAFLGEPEKRTVEMLVDQINASGGVNGEKIKLTVYDDGADADLPLNLHPATIRASAGFDLPPFSGPPEGRVFGPLSR